MISNQILDLWFGFSHKSISEDVETGVGQDVRDVVGAPVHSVGVEDRASSFSPTWTEHVFTQHSSDTETSTAHVRRP